MGVTAFAFANPLIAPIVFDIEGPKDAFISKSAFNFDNLSTVPVSRPEQPTLNPLAFE